MRRTLLIFLTMCTLAAGAVPAAARQVTGTIRGRALSSEGDRPLSAATVALRVAGDTAVLAQASPDPSGQFRFDGLSAGRYIIAISYLGHVAQTHDVTVVDGEVDMGTLRLTADVIELDAVTVEAERPAATFAPDRDIYLADAMPAASGGVATELIGGIPELEVDIDGAVMFRGSQPIIHINGRPAPMSGEALNVFLQQFPADAIERIEVIPNPSARYDANGAAIVNIVLKEGASLGLSGSVYANAHTRGEAGIGGRTAWQRGDITLFGNSFLRRSDRDTDSYDLRQNLITDPTSYLRQDALSERGGLSGSFDFTVDWKLAEKTTLRTQAGYSDFGSTASGTTTTTHLDAEQEWTQRYDRISDTESVRRSLEAGMRLNHEFGGRNHELEVQVEYDGGRDDSDRRVETRFELLTDDGSIVPADLTLEDRNARNGRVNLEVTYERPLGERASIETGVRSRFDNREDTRLLEEFDDGQPGPPIETTVRGFDRREVTHAAYLTLNRTLGPVAAQAGLRAELEDNQFRDPTGATFDTRYFDFFPSANITYRFGEGSRNRARFSYSRRTRRPSPESLNPIDRSTDPLNRRLGNPDLEPQYTHSFGLDLNRTTSWGSLRASPYYRRVTNDWTDIRTIDEDGIATTMPRNVASQDMYGAALTASLKRRSGWGGFLSVSGNGERRDASNLSSLYSGSSFRWSVRGNVTGVLTSTLSARSNLSYTPPRDVAQGRISSRIQSDLSLRQQLLGGKASLSLTVRDPFELSGSTFENRDPTFLQIGRSDVTRRSVAMSFSYNFGGGGKGRGGG